MVTAKENGLCFLSSNRKTVPHIVCFCVMLKGKCGAEIEKRSMGNDVCERDILLIHSEKEHAFFTT